MIQPGRRRRATDESNAKTKQDESVKNESAEKSDKTQSDLPKQEGVSKMNSILPAKQNPIKIVPPTKQRTVDDSQGMTEDSDIISKKGTLIEEKIELKHQAKMKKGNEEERRSFHYRMNIFNLVSSFLGIFGLVVQIIEVILTDQVPSLLQ